MTDLRIKSAGIEPSGQSHASLKLLASLDDIRGMVLDLII